MPNTKILLHFLKTSYLVTRIYFKGITDGTLQFHHVYSFDSLTSIHHPDQSDEEERIEEDRPLTLDRNDFSISSNIAVPTEGDTVSFIIVCLKTIIFLKT